MLPFFMEFGAGKESRTLDLNLGKVALYQLSYSRVMNEIITPFFAVFTKFCFFLNVSVQWVLRPQVRSPQRVTPLVLVEGW